MTQPESSLPISVEDVRQHLINFIERTWLFDKQADDFIWVDIDRRAAVARRMEVVRESRQVINETIAAIGGLTCNTTVSLGGDMQAISLGSWDGLSEQGMMLWTVGNQRQEFEGTALLSDLRSVHP